MRPYVERLPRFAGLARIPNVKRETLTDFVLDHIARGTEVRTDAYRGYNDVGRDRLSQVARQPKESCDPPGEACLRASQTGAKRGAGDPVRRPGR
jgi:hypothetical protein